MVTNSRPRLNPLRMSILEKLDEIIFHKKSDNLVSHESRSGTPLHLRAAMNLSSPNSNQMDLYNYAPTRRKVDLGHMTYLI